MTFAPPAAIASMAGSGPSSAPAWGSITGKQVAGSYQPLASVLTNTTAAVLRDRATHTGTQAAATISDFTEAAQDVVGGMVTAAGGTYNDAAGTVVTVKAGSFLKYRVI